MSRRPDRDQVSNDGLRYTARQAGSPYGISSAAVIVKSCFLCGNHKQPGDGQYRKLLGQSRFVCFGCKPANPAP